MFTYSVLSYCRETWTLAGNTGAAATHERKKIPLGCSWKFFTKLQPPMILFSPDRRPLCFFHCRIMNNKPRLLMNSFYCTLMKAAGMQCRLHVVFLEQLTWTYAYSINKLFKKHTLPIHCPLMNHSWATHEPLMNSSHLATRGASGSWFLFQ